MGNEDHASGAGTATGLQASQGMMPPSEGVARHCDGDCGQIRCRTIHRRPRRWRALGCLLPAAGLLLAPGVPAAHAQVLRLYSTMKSTNTPGLRCWGSRVGMAAPVMVYEQPLPAARSLGVTHSMVAATGAPRDGFLPVITSVGVRGFVVERDVIRDSWMKMPCVVRRNAANGYLTFSYGLTAVP